MPFRYGWKNWGKGPSACARVMVAELRLVPASCGRAEKRIRNGGVQIAGTRDAELPVGGRDRADLF